VVARLIERGLLSRDPQGRVYRPDDRVLACRSPNRVFEALEAGQVDGRMVRDLGLAASAAA
jgi:hypothetical protein